MIAVDGDDGDGVADDEAYGNDGDGEDVGGEYVGECDDDDGDGCEDTGADDNAGGQDDDDGVAACYAGKYGDGGYDVDCGYAGDTVVQVAVADYTDQYDDDVDNEW